MKPALALGAVLSLAALAAAVLSLVWTPYDITQLAIAQNCNRRASRIGRAPIISGATSPRC
jgi:hypothetical protein